MITDEEHPRMKAALADLNERLAKHIVGRELDGSDRKILDDLEELLEYHQQLWSARGVAFPDLTALIIPRLGFVRLVRRDWEQGAIEQEIVNTTVNCPDATPQEIAQAVKYAWPGYKPRFDKPLPRAVRSTITVGEGPEPEGVRVEKDEGGERGLH